MSLHTDNNGKRLKRLMEKERDRNIKSGRERKVRRHETNNNKGYVRVNCGEGGREEGKEGGRACFVPPGPRRAGEIRSLACHSSVVRRRQPAAEEAAAAAAAAAAATSSSSSCSVAKTQEEEGKKKMTMKKRNPYWCQS